MNLLTDLTNKCKLFQYSRLEEKLDKILISVLEIPAVSEYVCEKIAE